MSTTAVEIPGYVAGTYTIDPGHSDVAFTVRHLMVSKVRGHFTRFQGELALAPDPLASSVTATIELASIDTNNPQRDDDLRSANFFETDTYPTMTFRSVGIRHSEDGFDVDGELTLHEVTRPSPSRWTSTASPATPQRHPGRLLGHHRAGPGRLRHQHQHPHGRRRGGHRGPGPGLPRDRSRPQPTPAGQPLALTADLQEESASRFPDRTQTDSLRAGRAPGPGRANRSGGNPRPGPSR